MAQWVKATVYDSTIHVSASLCPDFSTANGLGKAEDGQMI